MIVTEIVVSTSIVGIALLVWNFVIQKWQTQSCVQSCISEKQVIVGVSPEPSHEEDNVSIRSSKSCSSSGRDSLASDTPLSSTQGSPRPAGSGLSRRQKKNSRKKDKDPAKKKKTPVSVAASPALSRTNSDDKCSVNNNNSVSTSVHQLPRSKKKSVICKQYEKLSLPDHSIYNYLQSYLLTIDQLRQLGFPQESSLHPGKAYIYKDPEFSQIQGDTLDDGEACDSRLDANAVPFYPSLHDSDSDSSGATRTPERKSSSGEISALNVTAKEFIPTTLASSASCSLITSSYSNNTQLYTAARREKRESNQIVERVCVRCNKNFSMQSYDNEYLEREPCHYHWGKQRSKANLYTCCQAKLTRGDQSRGCTSAPCHVWSGLPRASGIIGPLQGYVKTKLRKSYPTQGNFGVYGVDCEMCYTRAGLELAKVTVVGVDGRLVYESLVCPDNEIIDYNTRYSGISAKDFASGQHKNIKEVQNDLMGFINADTILVGHGLENDLRSLNLIHNNILDTAVVFPHFNGLPFRRSLRSLVSSYLKRDIQISDWGHDSYEDARACIELMLWKTRKDLASRKLPENLHQTIHNFALKS